MSQPRLPPPAPTCLCRRYSSSQKGGTLIVEDVDGFEAHARRLCDPDGYRPQQCPGCFWFRLHVHDYRDRTLRAEAERASVRVVRHLCPNCGAVWLILPLFIARLLRRTWRVVEACVLGPGPSNNAPTVPKRTARRWAERLRAAASLPVQVLAQSANEALVAVATAVGLDATREQLVLAYAAAFGIPAGERLAALAALLHRLAPRVRLM